LVAKYPHKVFGRDRILRDSEMKPVGRVILARDYKAGEDIAITLLRVPKGLYPGVLGQVFYVDGYAYRVPVDIDPVKVGGNRVDHLINGFYLEKVK